MFLRKVSLFSIVIWFILFDIMHCQDTPPRIDSLWVSGGAKSGLNNLNWFPSEQNAVYRQGMVEKCEKNGYPHQMEEAVNEYTTCTTNFTPTNEPADNLPSVPELYCSDISHMKNCYIRMANKMRLCLNTRERQQLDNALDAVQQLIGYLCDNQGKKLSEFFADGGPVCFDKLKGPLIDCMNRTILLSRNLELGDRDADIFEQMFETKQCKAIEAMRDCMVGTLRRHCDRPTPADMTATMMDIFIKGTPCKDLVKPSAAAGVSGVHALLAVTAVVALLLQPAP